MPVVVGQGDYSDRPFAPSVVVRHVPKSVCGSGLVSGKSYRCRDCGEGGGWGVSPGAPLWRSSAVCGAGAWIIAVLKGDRGWALASLYLPLQLEQLPFGQNYTELSQNTSAFETHDLSAVKADFFRQDDSHRPHMNRSY